MENDDIFEISAKEVTVEVTDEKTGQSFRRTLPIDYLETAHCLRLMAEDLDGKPSELVFFSDLGKSRLRDMTGGGADKDPCGGHSGKL